MMTPEEFHINLTDEFDHLPSAPIVEAVIHWRALSDNIQKPDEFCEELKRRLQDYPASQPQHEIVFQAMVGSEDMATTMSRPNWSGFRFTSANDLYIAQFMKDGFALSRLRPYENWKCFETEALRLWQMYLEIAKPTEVQRLAVRFINSISIHNLEELEKLLAVPPKSPLGIEIPLTNFTHQSTFTIPRSSYNLNVIQTVQPANALESGKTQFILDFDVFTTQVPEIDENSLKHLLSEMRWIKNKAFFAFLSPSAIDRFKEKP